MGIQLGGNIQFGSPLADASDFISQLTINTQRESIARRATFGKPRASTRAGAFQETVTIMFESDFDTTSFWADLWDAQQTDSAEIGFAATFDEGAVSADNLEFSGTLVVTTLDTGGTVGQAREQTITLPVTSDGIQTSETATP